jgi:hypothetical protein
VNVTTNVNSFNIDRESSAFTSRLEQLKENVLASEATKARATDLIFALQRTQEVKAVWLDYLRVRQEFTTFGARSRVEHIVHSDDSSVIIALHQPTDGSQAGLPQGCNCNSIQFLEVGPDYVAKKLASVDCVNIFDVKSPSGSSYTVYNHAVSYNSTYDLISQDVQHCHCLTISAKPKLEPTLLVIEYNYLF